MEEHERTMLRQAKIMLTEYEMIIVNLALLDEQHHIREKLQRLEDDADPTEALSEIIRINRGLRTTPSYMLVESTLYIDIEMALNPKKRERRKQTAYEIVYRDDLTLAEKAEQLYQLSEALDKEIEEEFKNKGYADWHETQAMHDRVCQRLGISNIFK